jgi:hypothetical protein
MAQHRRTAGKIPQRLTEERHHWKRFLSVVEGSSPPPPSVRRQTVRENDRFGAIDCRSRE